jgi:hypothetical protein
VNGGKDNVDIDVQVKRSGLIIIAVYADSRLTGSDWEKLGDTKLSYNSHNNPELILLAKHVAVGDSIKIPQEKNFLGSLLLIPRKTQISQW